MDDIDAEEFSPSAVREGDSDDPVKDAVKASLAAKATPKWASIKRPHPSEFFVSKEVWEQVCYCLMQGENLLLVGPTGSGKSQIVYKAAEALDRPLVTFNMGAMSEARTSLIGNTHFDKERGTWFGISRFAAAAKGDMGPAIILTDEITRAVRDAFNILLPLWDDQGYLALDESEDASIINRHEEVSFVATANVDMEYTGTEAMDIALKNRFATIIDMDFPPLDNEVSVLMGRCDGL